MVFIIKKAFYFMSFCKSLGLGIIILACSSCSTSSSFSWKQERPNVEVNDEDIEKLEQGAIKAWDKRHEQSSLLRALQNFEILFYSLNKSKHKFKQVALATFLSRGYYFLAEYHEEKTHLKMHNYKLGGEWAQRGFETNKYFQTAVGDRGYFGPGLKFLDDEYVGCMYWYLANVGKWALGSGVNTTIKYQYLIKEISARIIELNEKYNYGGIYRILGAYYAVIPSYAGGDLNKSWDYFQKSLQIGPEYLGTKVLLAQAFAVYRNDEILFNKIISEVIKAKLDNSLDIYSENIMEQKKAYQLLSKIEELFE